MASRAKLETRKAETNERRKVEAELDKALAQTFPASDPFSVGRFTGTEPPSRPVDRQAPRMLPEAAGPEVRKPTRSR